MRRSSGPQSDQLRYNVYLDPAKTTVWGDGTQGTQFFSIRNPSLRDRTTVPIYGRVPAGQDVGAGTYADTLVITVNY
jgi:spore coat protein U-like protein